MPKAIIILIALILPQITLAQDNESQQKDIIMMDQQRMESIVKEMADEAKGKGGIVEFIYLGVNLYLISDAKNNRMRIISPIANYHELDEALIERAMQANFHTALDARYALSDGVLYAAYIHPIAELERIQLMFAVHQVANLAATFGTEFSSGGLQFGQPAEESSKTKNTVEL